MTPRLQKIRIDWNDDRLLTLPGVAKAIKGNPDITPDDIFETLVANDPTKTGKFVGWMLKAWENRDFQWEDIRGGNRSQINQTMRDFETFKRMRGTDGNFLIDEKNRSIMVHAGPQALWQFMMAIPELKSKMENDGPDTESNRHRKKMVSAKAHMEAWQKTYPSGLKVTVPFTLFASQFFGRNTKWCTTEDDGYNFSSYTNDGPLMIFTLPDGTRFQGHINISEYSEYDGRIEDCDISFMNEADIPPNEEQKAKILEHASDFKEAFYEFSNSFLNGNESEVIFNEIMKRESGNRQATEVSSVSNDNTSEKVPEFTMEIPEDYMEVINGKHIFTTMPMNASSEFNIIVDYLYKNDVNFEQKLKSLITRGCSNHREKYGKQLFIGSVLDKTDFDFMKIDRMENVDNDADSFPSCGVRRNLAEIAADLPKKYLPRFGYNTIMALDDDGLLAKKIAMDINNDCFHPTEHLLSYVNDPQSGAWSQVRMLNRFMELNPHTEMVNGNESEVILRHFPSLDLETILKKSMDGMHDPDFDDCDRPESVIKFLLGNGMSHTMLSRNAELNEFIRNCNRMTHPISGCNYPEATDYAQATINSVISNFGVPVMTPEIREFMKASPCNQYDEIMETYRAVCEMSFANIERSGRSLGLDEQTMASVIKHIRTNRNGYESEYVEPVVNRLTIFTDGRRRFPSDPEMS